jgi:putative transposase
MLRSAVMPKNEILAAATDVFGKWPCMGTPEILITDQGKEFKALTFTDGCLMLGIDVQYTPVLKPWLKGRVERFFRTLTTDVFQRVPGTTFSKLFDLRKEVIPEKVAVVTIDELRDHMLRFVVDVHNVRPHRVLRRSPLQEWESSVQQHGMRPLPDPETVVAALSNVAHRVPQHYGIEYEGLRYNSPEVAAYRIRPDAERERAVKIAVDPRDLTSIRFLDRATNRYVSVPILPGLLGRMRGVTLEKHRLARALQRANMEALAGEAGLLRAYTLIDDAMRAKGSKDGRANRLSAARYWEKLTKARPPEDPPAFDTLASRSGVTDGLFGDVWAPPPQLVPEPPEAPAQARPAATDAPAPDMSADTDAPGTAHAEDDVDLEAIARRLGMDGDGVS